MAKKIGDYSIGIKYEVDKTSFNDLQNSLMKIEAMGNLAKPGNEMTNKLKEAGAMARQVGDILDLSFNKDLGTVNITKFNQLLKQSNITIHDMATKFAEAGNVGTTAFNKLGTMIMNTQLQIKKSNKLLTSMFETLTNTVQWGISSSIINNISGSIQKAYGYVQDLDKSLNDIRIVTGKSSEEMENFAIKANQAAKNLGQTTTAYTEASLIYYQQGLGDKEAQARADVTLKAANVTGQSAQAVSEQLTAVWNGYKVSAEEAELYIDRLAAVAASSASDLEELSIGMSKVASAANAMGVGEEQLAAQISTIISTTRQAPESVGTALKTIYARMSDIKMGSDEAEITLGNYTKKMAQMGVNVLDANGQLREMGDVIEEIGGKWQSMSKEQQVALAQTMAGTRQYNNLIALFENWDQYTEMLNVASNAQGTLQEQEDIYMESTAAHLKQLKATWEDLYSAIFKTDEINKIIDLGTNLVQVFDNFFDSFGGGIKSIVAFGAIVANIFNKQIISHIIKAREEQQNYQRSIDVAAQKRNIAREIMSQNSNPKTPLDVRAKTEAQATVELYEKIEKIAGVISHEEYNRLTTMQQEVAALKGQAAESEKIMKNISDAANLTNGRANKQLSERENGYFVSNKKRLENGHDKTSFKITDEDKKRWMSQSEGDTDKEIQELEKEKQIYKNILDILNRITNVKISNANKEGEIGEKQREGLKNKIQELGLNKDQEDYLIKQLDTEKKHLDIDKQDLKVIIDQLEARKKAAAAGQDYKQNKDKADTEENNFDSFIQQDINNVKFSESITTTVAALGTLASAIASINGLMQIWSDEEATIGQKLTQTFITLGMLVPSVTSGIQNLSKGLKALNIIRENQIRTNRDLATSEELVQNASEASKKSLMSNPYGWILLAVAALASGIMALTDAIKKNNKAMIEAGEAAREEQKKIDELKDSYEELKSQYDKDGNNKEELLEKTQELSDALEDENLAVYATTGQWEKFEEALQTDYVERAIENQTKLKNALEATEKEAINFKTVWNDLFKDNEIAEKIFDTFLTGIDVIIDLYHNVDVVEAHFKIFAEQTKNVFYQVRDYLGEIFEPIKNLEFEDLIKGISKVFSIALSYFNMIFNPVGTFIVFITKKIGYFIELIKGIGKIIFGIIEIIDPTFAFMITHIPEFLESAKTILQTIIKKVSFLAEIVKKSFTNSAIYQIITNSLETIYTILEKIVNILNKIPGFTRITDGITDIVNAEKGIISGKNNGLVTTLTDKESLGRDPSKYKGLNDIALSSDMSENRKNLQALNQYLETAKEENDEELAKIIQNQIDEFEKQLEDSNEALYAIISNDLQKEPLESASNYGDYQNIKNDLINKIKEDYAEENLSDDEIEDLVNARLQESGKFEEYIQQEKLLNTKTDELLADLHNVAAGGTNPELLDKDTGELTTEAENLINNFMDYVNQDSNKLSLLSGISFDEEDFAILQKYGDDTASAYNEIMTKHSEELKANFQQTEAGKLSDNASTILSDVRNGNINSAADLEGNEDWDALSSQLDYIKQIYPEIADEVNILNSEAAVGTKEWAEALADVQDKMHALALDGLNKDLSDAISELSTIDIDANPDEFEEAMDKIMDAEYAIDVELHAEGVQEFENAEAMLKNVADTAGKIGENFIVAADDVRELNQTFPGVLEGCQYLTDGTIQLSKESAEAAMTAANAEAQSANTAAIAKIQDEQKVLLAKAETYDSMAEIAESAAQGEVESKQAASQINQKIMRLDAENDAAATNAEIENDKIIADTSIDNATAYGQNWIEAYNAVVQASAEATDAAQANQESLINGGGAVQNSLGRLTYNAIHQGTSASATEATINENDLDSIDWNAIAERYRSMADAARRDANDMDGMISELLAQGMKDNADLKSLGKGKGGGGGSNKDPDFIDYLEDERDRYHDINIQIALCEKALEKLNSQQKKLVGVDLAKNLMEQTKQLQKQVLLNKEKLKIMQKEKEELTETLSKGGVEFAEDGTIANYGDILADKLDYVNSLTEQYNKMSASEQENFKAIVEAAQKDYEKFKENIERYDELISEEMPEIEQKVQDLTDQKIDLQIEAFSIEINAKLNLAEAQRQWNQFLQDVVYKDKSTSGNAERMRQDLLTYYNPIKPKISSKDIAINTQDITTGGLNDRNSIQMASGGIVQDDTNRVNELMEQLRQIEETGTSSVYGDNKQKLLEDLKAANDQLMEDMTNFEELIEQVNQEYLNAIDNVASTFETLNKEFEYTSSLIQHDMKIIQQLYGDDYAAMDKYYDKQTKNYNDQLSSQKEMVSYWKDLMDKEEAGSDAWKKYKEEWQNATSELNSTVEASIENLLNKYQNTINQIMNDMNNKLTNGKGLNYTKSEWDLVKKESNMYLDNIEGAYAISQLQSKYQKSIDSTTSITAQKRLNDLMNEEIGMLKEKDKLTQYDIDRANAKYDLTLKQIALEEAQQNKSQMRLKRDSQGNYTYQYAADDAAIAEAEDGYNNALNKLYKMDKDEYNKNLDDIFNYYQEWQQKIAEAAQIKDNEERERTLRLYKEHYGNIINGLVEENEVIKQNLYESTEIALEEYYANNAEAFKNMTDEEKMAWMGEEGLIPGMLTSVQELVKQLADPETGFGYISGTVMQEIISVTEEYKQELADLEAAAGVNFKNIKNGIDPVIGAMNELIDKDKEELSEMEKQLEKTKEIKEEVDKLYKSYEDVKNKAVEAATKVKEAWKDGMTDGIDNLNKKILEMIENINKMIASINEGWKSIKTDYASPSSGGNGGGSGDGTSSPVKTVGKTNKKSHTIQIFSHGSSYSNLKYIVEDGKKIKQYIPDDAVIKYFTAKGVAERSVQMWLQNLNKSFTAQYDTGGYTGNWNSSEGKMAMLHEKELVLNKEDTKNMLNAVSIVRNMSGLLNSLNDSMLARVNAMQAIPSLSYAGGSSGGGDIKQDIVINASFPDATNRDEISAAFENLLGRAAQYVNDKSL